MKSLTTLIAKTNPKYLSGKERDLRAAVLGKWEKENDLAEKVWPGDQHQMEYFRKTRERLLKRVIGEVLAFKETSPYQGKFAECHKELAALHVLQSSGHRKEMIYFAERLIKKALRYEITDVIVATADIIYHHYGSVIGNQGLSKKYLDIIEEYEPIQLAERKANRSFVHLASHFAKSRVGNQETKALAKKYAGELLHGLSQYNSFRYHYFTYWIQSIHAQLQKDNTLLLEICDRALRFFQGKSYPIPQNILFIFGFEKRASLALETKDYDLAGRAVKMGMDLMQNSPYNYSICLIYKAMIGFHKGDNELVHEAIQESQDYRNFAQQKEQWHIIDAFAHFLDIEGATKFKLGKFLNQVPLFSQDKQGLNITIIVIQVLHYIKQNQFGNLIDRFDALQKYTTRHLKRDHTYRSNCFLKMILLLPAKNFHPVAIERHAATILKKMDKYQESGDVEIVPYERLWREVMKCLEFQYVK